MYSTSNNFDSLVKERDFSCDVKKFSYCLQQKILLRVAMTDDTTRAKAMKTAVQFKGNNDVNPREPDDCISC